MVNFGDEVQPWWKRGEPGDVVVRRGGEDEVLGVVVGLEDADSTCKAEVFVGFVECFLMSGGKG